MRLEKLNCPSCGAPLSGDIVPDQQIECASCGSVFIATELQTNTNVMCSHCHTINPAERDFCSNCGKPLMEDCILCHTNNPVGTVFCTNCGAHLANARARRKQMLEQRRKLRRERTQAFETKEARQKEEKLQRLLADLDEPENHDFAIYQINRMGVEAIESLIETLLSDHDPDARYGSARALGQICNEHQVKALIKARAAKALVTALEDHEPAVRYWSAHALGKCGSQSAVNPLAALLKDEHEGVRQQARRALEKIGGRRVREILEADDSKGIFNWIKGK